MFAALVAVAIVAIVGVVGFVLLRPRPGRYTTVPMYSGTVSPSATPDQAQEVQMTPVPSLSPANDIDTIGKELQNTKIESVNSEFTKLDASASSL